MLALVGVNVRGAPMLGNTGVGESASLRQQAAARGTAGEHSSAVVSGAYAVVLQSTCQKLSDVGPPLTVGLCGGVTNVACTYSRAMYKWPALRCVCKCSLAAGVPMTVTVIIACALHKILSGSGGN